MTKAQVASCAIGALIVVSWIARPRTPAVATAARVRAVADDAAPRGRHAIAVLTRGYAELSGYDALIARNRAIERHVLPKLTPGLWEMLIFHEVWGPSRAPSPPKGARALLPRPHRFYPPPFLFPRRPPTLRSRGAG